MMKTIKRFESEERLVLLSFFEFDNTYTVSILTRDDKSNSRTYKTKVCAERKFSEYQNYPLEALGVK